MARGESVQGEEWRDAVKALERAVHETSHGYSSLKFDTGYRGVGQVVEEATNTVFDRARMRQRFPQLKDSPIFRLPRSPSDVHNSYDDLVCAIGLHMQAVNPRWDWATCMAKLEGASAAMKRKDVELAEKPDAHAANFVKRIEGLSTSQQAELLARIKTIPEPYPPDSPTGEYSGRPPRPDWVDKLPKPPLIDWLERILLS
jgi:hypothetical protein